MDKIIPPTSSPGVTSEVIPQVGAADSVPSTKEDQGRNKGMGILFILLSVLSLPLVFFAPMAGDSPNVPIALQLIVMFGFIMVPPSLFVFGISYLVTPPKRIAAADSVSLKVDIPKKNWAPGILFIVLSMSALLFSFSIDNITLASFCFVFVVPFFLMLGVSYLRTPPVRRPKANAEMPKDKIE